MKDARHTTVGTVAVLLQRLPLSIRTGSALLQTELFAGWGCLVYRQVAHVETGCSYGKALHRCWLLQWGCSHPQEEEGEGQNWKQHSWMIACDCGKSKDYRSWSSISQSVNVNYSNNHIPYLQAGSYKIYLRLLWESQTCKGSVIQNGWIKAHGCE